MVLKWAVISGVSATVLVTGTLLGAMLSSNPVVAGSMQHQHGQSAESHGQHKMAANQPMQQMAQEVITEGVVSRIIGDSSQLIVHHQPIPEWKMSEMQMKFGLAPNLSVSDFSEGQAIRFRLKHENMMKFTITEVLQ